MSGQGEDSSDQKLVSFSIVPKQASKPKIELKNEMKQIKAAMKSERSKEEQKQDSRRSLSKESKLKMIPKPMTLKTRKPNIKRHF
mmetsp:Transcript_39951/g.61121  ORF Transcript_39951/g.61121 Transcript_39951/m.61121 type:complete len:85 (-) Transcript_39951:379-633(-)